MNDPVQEDEAVEYDKKLASYEQEDEERRLVHEILDQQKKWILGTGSTTHYAFTEDLLVNAFRLHSEQKALLAFEHGRAVGKYQAADSLYGHTTTMWVFKDGDLNDPKIEYPERINELLKDCEALMNNNAREYRKYIKAQLTNNNTEGKDE